MNRNTSYIGKCPEPKPSDQADTKDVFCQVIEEFDPADFANTNLPSAVDVAVPLVDVLLQVDVEANISLPTPAREIKWMRKNVSLRQCKAVPSLLDPTGTVKLFITGVVHKNIQYVESSSGFIRDYSTDVPFSCIQSVELENELFFPLGFEYSNKNSVLERKQLARDGQGADRCETGSLTFEIYNEPIKCKIMASAVNSLDIYQNFDNMGKFNQVIEKMEVLLLVKLIQKQQVSTDLNGAAAIVVAGNEASTQTAARPAAVERVRQIFGRLNG